MKHRFFFTFSGKGKEEDDFTYEQNPKYIYVNWQAKLYDQPHPKPSTLDCVHIQQRDGIALADFQMLML